MAQDPLLSHDDFAAHLPRVGRLIGLDLGTKTIGLALSDLGRGIASPLETIKRKKFTAKLPLKAWLDEDDIAKMKCELTRRHVC